MYHRDVVPERAPEQGESWQAVMADLDKVVMSGVTHWHHPQFHAYFPTANSYRAIVADILSGILSLFLAILVRNASIYLLMISHIQKKYIHSKPCF